MRDFLGKKITVGDFVYWGRHQGYVERAVCQVIEMTPQRLRVVRVKSSDRWHSREPFTVDPSNCVIVELPKET